MKKEIKTFSEEFVDKLGKFVSEIRREEEVKKDLTGDEVLAVILTTFHLLGRRHKNFSKKAGLKN